MYRARQHDLDRSVVIKVLTNLDEETTRRRFDRERKAMGRLSQATGIAPLYGSGFTPNGQPYLLMPFYEQGSLQDRLGAGSPIPPLEVQAVGVSIANAVQTAHENGVLHRDLKPANILITRSGKADVADFGIAHLVDDALGTSQALTMTPLYTAPEVFDGAEAGVLGDVYSLGATLFALLRGYPAYGDPAGTTPVLSLMRRINEEPLPALPATVPVAMAAVIERAMSKDPARRPASAGELASQLAAADMTAPKIARPKVARPKRSHDTESATEHRRSPIMMAAAVAVLLAAVGGGVLALLMLRDDGESATTDDQTATTVPIVTPTALSVTTPTPVSDSATAEPFNTAAAATAARSMLLRVEAYSCAGVDVATGVMLDAETVVTSAAVLESPWYIDVSTRGRVAHAEPLADRVATGLGLLAVQDTNGLEASNIVSISHGEQVAIVGIDGQSAVAEIVAPDDPDAPLQAVITDTADGNAIESIDAVLTESGALVGVTSVDNEVVEVLSPDEIRNGTVVTPDYDCSPTFDRDLGAADIESITSPAIAELLTMQRLSNAYAAEQWDRVRVLEPGKRVYTDQQFINGWRPLRQGYVYPVDRQIDDNGQARWRIGLIGYETWNGNDLTTLFCLTWTVDPVSGAVVQTNEDNVLIYGSQPGEERRSGFIRPATLRPFITENCPLES